MHIPDGFLDTRTIAATTGFSAVGVAWAWRQTKTRMTPSRVPLLGVTAAFVFAAQMLNFPVAAGTSGHLIGAVLTAILLGPAASVIVITTVLVVQCFLFADGGVLALGANIFNMAIVGSAGGYAIHSLVARALPGEKGWIASIAFSSWCSVVLASLCCAGELAWSGVALPGAVFPAMGGIHSLIGLGESLITSLVITALRKVRPDLLASGDPREVSGRYGDVVVYGILISVGLVLFILPFASAWPDGLERVAARLGFDQRAMEPSGVLPFFQGYSFPGMPSGPVAFACAGIAGVLLAFGFSLLLSRALTKKERAPDRPDFPRHV